MCEIIGIINLGEFKPPDVDTNKYKSFRDKYGFIMVACVECLNTDCTERRDNNFCCSKAKLREDINDLWTDEGYDCDSSDTNYDYEG